MMLNTAKKKLLDFEVKVQNVPRVCCRLSKEKWSLSWSVKQLQSLLFHKSIVRFFPVNFCTVIRFSFVADLISVISVNAFFT